MKRKNVFVVGAILFVLALISTATFLHSTPAKAAAVTEVISECDVVRQQENTPPTNAWVLYTRTPASAGVFGTGPGEPPLGDGSLQLTTPTGGDKVFLFNYEHVDTPLSAINAIAYSTYQTAGPTPPASTSQVPAINIQIDVNGGTLNTGEFATLVFEPVYNTGQGAVAPGVWQNWDAYNGGQGRWWVTGANGTNSGCDATEPLCTWNEILMAFPNATIVGGFGVNQGSGNPGLSAATDRLVLGYDGDSFTYNFDVDADCDDVADGDDNCPTTANADQADTDDDDIGDVCDTSTRPTNKDQCKNGGWMRFNDPAFRNQGQCIAFVNQNN